MLGEVDTRGKGYALDTVMAILRYAFKELGLNRLNGDVIDYNSRSIDFAIKKLGWHIEGRRSEAIYRNGQYHDQILVGMTHKQYDEFMKNNDYWNS